MVSYPNDCFFAVGIHFYFLEDLKKSFRLDTQARKPKAKYMGKWTLKLGKQKPHKPSAIQPPHRHTLCIIMHIYLFSIRPLRCLSLTYFY